MTPSPLLCQKPLESDADCLVRATASQAEAELGLSATFKPVDQTQTNQSSNEISLELFLDCDRANLESAADRQMMISAGTK